MTWAPAVRKRSVAHRASKFGIVGVAGLVINLVVQAALTELLGWNYIVSAVLATQVSSTFNFFMAERWVFGAGATRVRRGTRYVSFLLMNNAALLLRAPMMWVLVDKMGQNYVLANLVSLMVLTVIRFTVADRVIWRKEVGAT
jgi:putative flippase GtrA